MFIATSVAEEEPVTVAAVKAHLRVTHAADDGMLASLITSAREFVEQVTGRALAAAGYRYSGKLKLLPLWPATIDSIAGLESDNTTWTTLAEGDDFTYDADTNRIMGSSYCTHLIEFTTVPGDAIPQPLKDAIILRVQADYEGDNGSAERYRSAASSLAWPYRLNVGV